MKATLLSLTTKRTLLLLAAPLALACESLVPWPEMEPEALVEALRVLTTGPPVSQKGQY